MFMSKEEIISKSLEEIRRVIIGGEVKTYAIYTIEGVLTLLDTYLSKCEYDTEKDKIKELACERIYDIVTQEKEDEQDFFTDCAIIYGIVNLCKSLTKEEI